MAAAAAAEIRCLPLFFALLALTALPVFLVPPPDDVPAPLFDPARVVPVSWKPRVFVYKGFLSPEECDHLIKLAKSKLEKSMVADNDDGKSVMSQVRTSSGMFLDKRQDEVIKRIEHRIATWTLLPEENAENIQILRYDLGQKYDAHYDYFHDKVNQARGGHRYATLLMYLSDVEKGGETVFPNAEGWQSQPKDDSFSECARNGYAVKPIKGDAVLFFSLNPDGTTDPYSLHASCPVIKGEKWSAPKWVRVGNFDNPQVIGSSESSDESDKGPKSTAEGEHKNEEVLMVGLDDMPEPVPGGADDMPGPVPEEMEGV